MTTGRFHAYLLSTVVFVATTAMPTLAAAGVSGAAARRDRSDLVALLPSPDDAALGIEDQSVSTTNGGNPTAPSPDQEDHAPDTKNAAPPSDIIVTGTRRLERTSAQSLSPIDIVDARALGQSSSYDLNDRIAQNVPSFNVVRTPGVDGAIFSRPASLRNLGPDETLVLVNGHRRHRSAFVDVTNQGAQAVDLAQIPSPSIGRVEVLRDGASAQYGSDAIAGVINVILDQGTSTVLTAQGGQYYAGDGVSLILTGRTGVKLPGGGSLSVSGDYNTNTATDRSIGIRNKLGQPDSKSHHFAYDLTLPIGGDLTLYSFGTYGRLNGWSEFGFRSAQAVDFVFRRSFFQDGPSAIYPTWTLTSLYPDGFASQFGARITDGEIVAGVKGEIAHNLTVDLSGRHGRNSIDYRLRNTINASLGPLSPTRFNAGEVVSSEDAANADFAYLFDAGLAKPVSVAFGGEYRSERFKSIPGDVASYQVGPLADLPSGSYGFPGLDPASAVDAARRSEAAYLDVEADLTGRLTVGVAGRYEHFSDFGPNFSYKLSGRYQVAGPLAVRATYSTGFKAPTPGQQYFTKVTTNPDTSKPAPFPIATIALLSPSDPLALAFGGKPLKAERSHSVSAGAVLQPIEGLTLTADYYHIAIDDRIGLTAQLNLPAGAPYTRIQFLINGYGSRSEGVDVVAAYTHALLGGRGTLTAAYNHNRTKIVNANPAVVTALIRPVIEDTRPRDTAVATLSYDRGRGHFFGRLRYFGSYVDAIPYDQSAFGFSNQRVSPIAFVDMSASFDLRPSTQLTVGAENVLGVHPDQVTSVLKLLGYKYEFTRPYDADGGQWYLRLVQRF